jgi:hypothetical protein
MFDFLLAGGNKQLKGNNLLMKKSRANSNSAFANGFAAQIF